MQFAYYLLTYILLKFLVPTTLSVQNTDELMQYLLHVWHGVNKSITDNITDEWWRFLKHVYGQTVNTSSNGCDNINIHSAMWHQKINFLSNMTRPLSCIF